MHEPLAIPVHNPYFLWEKFGVQFLFRLGRYAPTLDYQVLFITAHSLHIDIYIESTLRFQIIGIDIKVNTAHIHPVGVPAAVTGTV